ncbi:MAG: hypothetical protein AAFS01_00195 [Pseudomonadota bacterium]
MTLRAKSAYVTALWAIGLMLILATTVWAGAKSYQMKGRQFIVEAAAVTGPAPVVFALHGGMRSGSYLRDQLDLARALNPKGIHVVYLNGTPAFRLRGNENRLVWNAGACCARAERRNVDDLGFISDVISALSRQGLVDPRQVYLLGHSNGAMMSYRFACERSSQVAGVIAIAGGLVTGGCQQARGVRVLHIHGQRDTTFPIAGGGKGADLNATGDPFPSLFDTQAKLQGAGASVQVVTLDGAEHRVHTIENAMRREMGTSIGAMVADFVR